MISDYELNKRVLVRPVLIGTDLKKNNVVYQTVVDGKVIHTSKMPREAHYWKRLEMERLSIQEAQYDTGIKVRPESINKAKNMVRVENPDIRYSFPIAWKVYYGPLLIGAYKSEWEAIQYRDEVILNGGY